jgi:tyrosine-protein kinase Etk/Wzc
MSREEAVTIAQRRRDALRLGELMDTLDQVKQEDETVTAKQEGVDLFDVLLVLSEARRSIAIWVVIFMAFGGIFSLLVGPTFSAGALILPPQQGQSLSSSMMGQLGSLMALAGGGALKTPADMYIGILESRTIADHLIARFHLQELYKTKKMEDARTSLRRNSRFLASKDGLIHITVDDHDPNRASEMANAYVDELYSMNSHLAITEAAQRRLFFDEELADEKNALTIAENDLKLTAEKTGIIQLGGQAESIIRTLAQLRAEIASREVQISAMRTFATDQNPNTVLVQKEIDSLRDQLSQLERDPRNPQLSTVGIPAGQVPAIALEYARKLREVKYHESLFELLSKQYEAARIDEAKAAPVIQVVDRAVPPDKKSGPYRLLITLGCGFIGFCLGCLLAAVTQALRRAAEVPEYAIKLARLRSGFRFSL